MADEPVRPARYQSASLRQDAEAAAEREHRHKQPRAAGQREQLARDEQGGRRVGRRRLQRRDGRDGAGARRERDGLSSGPACRLAHRHEVGERAGDRELEQPVPGDEPPMKLRRDDGRRHGPDRSGDVRGGEQREQRDDDQAAHQPTAIVSTMLRIAGASRTTKIEGKISATSGKRILIGAFCARSSAAALRRSRISLARLRMI